MHAPCLIGELCRGLCRTAPGLPRRVKLTPEQRAAADTESMVMIDQSTSEQPVSTGSIGQSSLLA
jgi:hypothetical protein